MKLITIIMSIIVLLTACDKKEMQGQSAPQKRTPLVQTVTIKPEQTVFTRSFLVTLEPWQQTGIISKATGYITKIISDRGDFVQAGAKLALVEPDDLLDQKTSSEAALEAAQTNYENAKKGLERSESLLQKEFISQADADAARSAFYNAEAQLKAAKTTLSLNDRKVSYTEITAPYRGYIIKRTVEHGSFVSPSSGPLFIIGSIDRIKAYASVSQGDMRFFTSGKKVLLTIEGLPGKEFHGKVKRSSPSLDTSTRTLDIEIEFDNPSKALKPGMFGRIMILEDEKEPSIVLDPRAVLRKNGVTSVYTVESSKVKEVPVQLGRVLPDGRLEIASGISEGAEVIVIGRDLVRNGIEVKTVPYSERVKD